MQTEQQQQFMDGMSLPYQTPMQQYGDGVISLTDTENELYALEKTLRGIYEDKDGKIKKSSRPLMNEEGINSVMGIVRNIVNKNTIMSNLKSEEISSLMDLLMDTLAKDLMIHRNKYEIEDSATCDKIYFHALMIAFITFKRGFEQGEKVFLSRSVQEINTTVNQQNKKSGFLQNLFSGGK